MSKTERRSLNFSSLQAAVADARTLSAVGYLQLGKWNLARIVSHCNDWLRFPMDGYPPLPVSLSLPLWLVRVSVGRALLQKILRDGTMQAGRPTLAQTVQPSDFGDEVAMIAALAETVERFDRFQGPLHPSPLFGAMTKESCRRLQIIHLEHHLSFLIPKSSH